MLDVQAKAGRTIGACKVIWKRAAERWLRCRMRPIWRLTGRRLSVAVERVDARRKLGQRRLDALAELVVHGLLFAAPVGRAAQDRRLCRLGQCASLTSMPSRIRPPAALRAASSAANLRSSALGAPDDVAPPGLAQPRQVRRARHAAIGDPHASDHAVTGFHGVDDGLHGAAVVGVAGEHLVAQREAVEGHHQARCRPACSRAGDRGCSRVAPAGWPPPRLRSRCWSRRTAAPRCRPRTARRTRRDRCASSSALCAQQQIERAIQPILVDQIAIELQQIAKRRAPVPVLGDVQLARRLAQPRRHQHRRHLRPGTRFLADGSSLLAQIGQARAPPQRQRQIDIAELPRAFDPHALQAAPAPSLLRAIVEQASLLGLPDQLPRQRPRLKPSALVELAELRHRLLDNATANPHAAHKTPVAMDLAVLLTVV